MSPWRRKLCESLLLDVSKRRRVRRSTVVFAMRSAERYLWTGGVDPIGKDLDKAHVKV